MQRLVRNLLQTQRQVANTLLAELWRDDTRSTDEDVRAEIA